jgi:hypothetical protein
VRVKVVVVVVPDVEPVAVMVWAPLEPADDRSGIWAPQFQLPSPATRAPEHRTSTLVELAMSGGPPSGLSRLETASEFCESFAVG